MKVLKVSVTVVIIFAVLCAVIVFPPKSSKSNKDGIKFLDFEVSADKIESAEEIARDIAEVAALAIPRSIRSIIGLYGVPFSMIGQALGELLET